MPRLSPGVAALAFQISFWFCLTHLSPAAFAGAEKEFWAQTTFVKGVVIQKIARGGNEAPLKIGAILHRGDMVSTAADGRASFLLSDGGIAVLGPSSKMTMGQPMAAGGPSLTTVAQNLSKALLSREGDNPMLKHLGGLRGGEKNLALAPRQTKVRVGNRSFQWLPAPGTTRYTLTVMGSEDDLQEMTVSGTRAEIAGEKLRPGTTYYWEVRDAAVKDSAAFLGSGSFTTLDRKLEETIQSLEKGIQTAFSNSSGDDQITPLFLTCQIYRQYGLNLDALLTLQKMIRLNPEAKELLELRRALCKDMGLEEDGVSALKQ